MIFTIDRSFMSTIKNLPKFISSDNSQVGAAVRDKLSMLKKSVKGIAFAERYQANTTLRQT